MPARNEANPNELNPDDARYGFRFCHLKNRWTAPLPTETELSRQMTTSTTSSDIMGLQAAYANLHTDQERDYFMQRYHDVIFFSSRRRHTRFDCDWSSDVCSSDLRRRRGLNNTPRQRLERANSSPARLRTWMRTH